MRRIALRAALFAIVATTLPADAHARQALEILEPAAWRTDATRGIAVRQRRGIKVVGIARSEAGVDRVTVDGAEAALTGTAEEVRFTGFANPTVEAPEVRVDVYVGDQILESATFPVEVEQSAQTFDDPQSAWEGGSDFGGERWAVVIGISEYEDRSVPALRYADDDARAFRNFLLSPAAGMGGFKPENVRFLVNEQATYREIRLAFRDFLKSATDEDVVFIFFAGHGAPDPERPEDLYLLAHDTEAESIAGTGFPMSEVTDAIRRTYARTIVSFIDACHSAGVSGDIGLRAIDNPINSAFLERARMSLGVQVSFTASQVNQFSQEGPQWGGGHGVFTYYLMRGLEGEADDDGDGIVTLGESLEWTRDRVRRETRNGQIPSISQTAFDASWPMSITGASATPVARPDEPDEPDTSVPLAADRVGDEPDRPERPSVSDPGRGEVRPAAPPASVGPIGDGLLVTLYGEGSPTGAAEAPILASLRANRSVRVLDVTGLGIADGTDAAVQAAAEGDFATLADMVQDQGGEFLFVGSLVTEATPPAVGPMYSGRAQLELRMYRVSTGDVVESRVFRVGMDGQPARPGSSELDARTRAAEEVGRLAAAAARGWLARALR